MIMISFDSNYSPIYSWFRISSAMINIVFCLLYVCRNGNLSISSHLLMFLLTTYSQCYFCKHNVLFLNICEHTPNIFNSSCKITQSKCLLCRDRDVTWQRKKITLPFSNSGNTNNSFPLKSSQKSQRLPATIRLWSIKWEASPTALTHWTLQK